METVGGRLTEARERKGVSLEQAARDTYISRHFLEALELEDFERFPGEAYLIGFLRSYSGYLGLEPDEALALYHNGRIQEQPAPMDELLDRHQLSKPARIVITVLIFLGIAALIGALVYFQVIQIAMPTMPQRTRNERPTVSAAPIVADTAEPAPAEPTSNGVEQTVEAVAPQRVNIETAMAVSEGEPQLEPIRVGNTRNPSRVRDSQTIRLATEDSVRIDVQATRMVLVRYQYDWSPAEEVVLQPGDSTTLLAQHQGRLWISNSGNVDVRLANTAIQLPASGEVVALAFQRNNAGLDTVVDLLPLY